MLAKTPSQTVLWLLLILVALVLGCSRKDETEVKIGAILPLSGDAAKWGEAVRKAVDLGVEEANSKGGIGGRKLVIIYEDTQGNPEKAASAMLKLATVDRVPLVLGPVTSSAALAAAPIAQERELVLLSPTAAAVKLSEAGPYFFRIWPTDATEAKAISLYATRALGMKEMPVLYIQNDWGEGFKDLFQKAFSDLGGSIPLILGYKPEETDFRPLLKKAAAQKPSAVLLASYYNDAALILKQAREMGITTQFLATGVIEEPKLFEVAGDAANGVIYSRPEGYDPRSPAEIVQHFKKAFTDRYGEEPGFVAAYGYDIVRIAAFCLTKGGMTGPDVRKAMAKVADFPGVTGPITFDNHGDVARNAIIKATKDGKFVLLSASQ